MDQSPNNLSLTQSNLALIMYIILYFFYKKILNYNYIIFKKIKIDI